MQVVRCGAASAEHGGGQQWAERYRIAAGNRFGHAHVARDPVLAVARDNKCRRDQWSP